MNEAARFRRDDLRREPRLSGAPVCLDPLAELARLVGQDDPYRSVFKPQAEERAPEADPEHWPVDPASPQDYDEAYGHGEAHHAHGDDPYADPHAQAWAEADAEGYAADPAYDDARYAAEHQGAYREEAGLADEHAAVEGARSAVPDLWAREEAEAAPPPPVAQDRASARRPLIALAAVLVLTGGGLAASFLAKGPAAGGQAVAARNTAPTIMAAAGPTKIKQDDPAATAPEDQDAALLNKNSAAVSGPVKVVPSAEQPLDLAQLPKSGGDTAAIAQQAASPFPEAKKVKTFVVHPNGTPLSEDGAPVAAAAPPPPAAESAAATPQSEPSSPTPTTATIASLAAQPAAPADPTPVAPAPAAKPDRSSDAGARKPPKTKPAGTGGFGVQLSAAPSMAAAHATFAKLQKQYPAELGGYSAQVHESQTGTKPVYRVRIGGMTHDEADSLCEKLKTGGGSCFVVHD